MARNAGFKFNKVQVATTSTASASETYSGLPQEVYLDHVHHHTRNLKHTSSVSTEEQEAKLGIHDIRHYAHSRARRYLGHVFRMDADRTLRLVPSLLRCCWVVDGKQQPDLT